MTEKKKIDVIIDGRNFTVVGADNESYVRNLAYYVDRKIKDVSSKNIRLSQTMAATLAALNIADEYHKTNIKLKDLENKAKDPLEKYAGVTIELKEAKDRIVELEKLCLEYKNEVLSIKINNEELHKELSKYKEVIDTKDNSILEHQKLIKTLQDKNFNSQMELVEVKKQLKEILRTLDNEMNLIKGEG